jgi:hypothetical protein
MSDEDKKHEVFEWKRCKEKTCNRKFFISVAEKEYFENKGYQLPERCYPCRVKRRTADGSNAKTT